MNEVRLSGTLIAQRIYEGRVPHADLEIFNPEKRDVFRCVVWGRGNVEVLPPLHEGMTVEVEGVLANVHWRTPGAGREVREIGIEVRRLRIAGGEEMDLAQMRRAVLAQMRERLRASEAQMQEVRRLQAALGWSEEELAGHLPAGVTKPEDLTRREAVELLQAMAEVLAEKRRKAPRPIEVVMGEASAGSEGGEEEEEEEGEEVVEEEQLAEWVSRLLEAPVGNIEDEVEALPADLELRAMVIRAALRQETRKTARQELERMLNRVITSQ